MPGATPKATRSASESYWMPKELVERVTELRHQDHHRREPVPPGRPAAGGIERADDRVEAREEPRRGEQVGQQVDALAQRRDAPAAAEADGVDRRVVHLTISPRR